MSFDQKAYLADVLKPLTRDKVVLADIQRALRDLQESSNVSVVAGIDLVKLLAIPADLSGLPAHLASLNSFLNKRQTAPAAQFLQKLIADMTAKGHDLTSPAFWTQLQSAKADAFKTKLADFAKAVSLEHQALRIITDDQLSEKAKSQGLLGRVPERDLVAAVEKSGIAVRPDFKVPSTEIPRGLTELGKFTEYRSIVDVLLLAEPQKATAIHVVDDLRYGPGGTPITIAKIEAAQSVAEKGRDTDALQAAQKALGILRSDFSGPSALQQLVLASFVATAKEMLARGELLASALTKLAKDTGLDEVDAARILLKLSGSTSTRNLTDVTNLVAEGALADARRTYDAVADAGQFGEAEVSRVATILTTAESKKAALVIGYQAALAKRDYASAATSLAQAAAIDKQDAQLADLLDKLPPPPPEQLTAKPHASGQIMLSWTSAGGSDCQFIVVRSTDGHAPKNTGDGTQLARDLTAAAFTDPSPPVARRIHYSVFAVRRGVSSLAASVEQVVLPGPAEVSVEASLTEITLMWRLVPEAVGIQVAKIDPDGSRSPVSVRSTGRVTVSGLVTGTKYRFTLEAIYVLPDGTRLLSPPVSIDASPRGAISAVGDLRVVDARLPDGRDGHSALWPDPPAGYPVELWAFPVDETLPNPGAEVELASLDDIGGRRVTGILTASSAHTVLNFPRFRELRVVAAITIDGSRGLFGPSTVVGSAPSVKNPSVERYGTELVVSWVWPHGDYAASVSWYRGSAVQSRVVSRAEYKINGGCRIPASGVDRVSIATVAYGNGQQWIASPVEVQIAAQLPVVRYDLEIPPARFGRRKPVRVTVRSDGFSGQLSLLVVARESSIMPSRAADGEVIDQLRVNLDGASPATLEFSIPRLSSPFWIRLFPDDGTPVKLDDPPTNQLKG